ncbi:peroxidase 24-like protein, partial [Tanacetum coccineum]
MRYYAKRCGSVLVENTVRGIVWSKVAADTSLAAKLLRLHYHDCFVRGCDGSILLDPTQNTTTEKTAGPNRSISGYETSLAARDAVSFQFRRDMWPVFTGRKDGRVSLASEVGGNLPSANANFTTLLSQFGSKGLNLNDLVTLSALLTNGQSARISRVLENLKVFYYQFAQSMVHMGAIEVLTNGQGG